MIPQGAVLAIVVVALALSGVALAHSLLTRRSDGPQMALNSLTEQLARLESLEHSWRAYKGGMDEQLEAMDDLRARTETARKRAAAVETRRVQAEGGGQQEEPPMTAAQQANLMWRQHKAGR